MKRSRFTEEQIAYGLRQAEAGTPVSDVCCQLGVSEATFYVWKKKFANLGVTELRKLRMLEEENARLKRVVGAFPDGHSALMLVAARLRHIASTKWGKRRYLAMETLLNPLPEEAAA